MIMSNNKTYEQLLLQNRAWVERMLHEDKDFFKNLSHAQTPEFLWIGCSDSRVPANQITGTRRGFCYAKYCQHG